MYNKQMADAFHALKAPEGFGVVLLDNDDFLTIQIDPESLKDLVDSQAEAVVKYINDVKRALEDHGAIVLVSREAIS
jgi:hypothetical protein